MYKVMIADDEPIVSKAMLALTDWQALECEVVYSACDGLDVLNNLEKYSPDILVTDIRMPGVNGIEIAKHIMEEKKKIQVIILTAYADFSYAQAALKYNVVDYITKTGAFEGLTDAIEKAKERIKGQGEPLSQEQKKNLILNLYKSVFDGSLYGDAEIYKQMDKLAISLEKYRLLLFHYRPEDNESKERTAKVTGSLVNFFSMVFGGLLHVCVPISRCKMVVILSGSTLLAHTELMNKCGQVVEMMDNFMKLDVYIGISHEFTETIHLKEAYDQAKAVFESNFLDDAAKISFYENIHESKNGFLPEIELQVDEVLHTVRKGMPQEAVRCFRVLTNAQTENDYSANAIKSCGILIQNECRRLLKDYDKTLYDITDLFPSITKKIYSSNYRVEYQELMETIIYAAAAFFNQAADRRSRLIQDCDNYINLHYQENISITRIAQEIGTSGSYLSRIFKESTGVTIISTINQKKLKRAKEYLEEGNLKIYEVADALGFENVTYFSHFFKKYTGVSPKEYMKRGG